MLDLIENIRAYGGCVFASLVSSTGDTPNAWIPFPYKQHGPTNCWNGRVGYRLGTTEAATHLRPLDLTVMANFKEASSFLGEWITEQIRKREEKLKKIKAKS